MTRIRHGIVGIVLAVLLIIQFYPIVQMKNLNRHHHFMETIVKPGALWESHSLVFDSEQQIPWSRKGKEIILNGKHIDVIASKKNGKQCILYCIEDEAEDHLLKKYGDWSHQHGKNKKPTMLIKWLYLAQPEVPQESSICQLSYIHTTVKWKESSLIKRYSEPESPPPERG